MNESKKPRIAEILGVEVGERFLVEGQRGGDPLYIGEDGLVRYVSDDGVSASAIQIAINHPDRIIRKPRWTEQDKEDARALKRLIPDAYIVWRYSTCTALQLYDEYNNYILSLNNCFATLPLRESVTLDEIIGGTNE